MENDIRWQQRFSNYKRAFNCLEEAVNQSKERSLTNLESQGMIQAFEFTHELAWNLMKDYFEYQGNYELKGSRDATREAFKNALIQDGEAWMGMLKSRNDSSHTYNQQIADDLKSKIINEYYELFEAFKNKFNSLIDKTI